MRRTRSRRLPEPLAERLSREQGKPVNGPNARFEVGACAAWAPATAATQLPVETVVDDAETHTELRYRPVGVVDAIGPWNWPMMITVCQVAPSLRMGNTVVVKPTEYTSLRLGGERGLGRRAAATFSTDGNETVSSSSRNLHHHLASAQLLPQR